MVIPWMENGSLRHYIEVQLTTGRLIDADLEDAIVQWASE